MEKKETMLSKYSDLLYPWTGILYDFLVTVKAAPHECVDRTGQP